MQNRLTEKELMDPQGHSVWVKLDWKFEIDKYTGYILMDDQQGPTV